MTASNNLSKYLKSDVDFIASYNEITGYYLIEQGEDYIDLEEENLSDEEITAWGIENGYLEDLKPVENMDLDELRDIKASIDLSEYNETPPTYATPSGRAFNYFSNLEIDLPPEIKIYIVDGIHPGNDWQGVIIYNLESIVILQNVLFEAGIKVNFELR